MDTRYYKEIASPNFLIIGATKSGTTTLYKYLNRHSDVFMPKDKEPAYFDLEGSWAKGERWYNSLFNEGRFAKALGEASTNYTRYPQVVGVPERIRDFNPRMKLIYIMRNPAERTFSHYVHRWIHDLGRGKPFRATFFDAIGNDPVCMDSSNYILQIEQYEKFFELSQMLFLTFEKLIEEPKSTIKRVLRFLSVDPSLVNYTENLHANSAKEAVKVVARSCVCEQLQMKFPLIYEYMKLHGPPLLNRLIIGALAHRIASRIHIPRKDRQEMAILQEHFEPMVRELRCRYGINTTPWELGAK